MGEVKQTNFRINQDTADAFRRFCEENGMNQAQGFDHVMQVVELDKAKATTPGRATEIEGFEKSVKDIMAAYLNSIEINNNAEARIREQFASSLDRKDKTIDELRTKVEELQASKADAETARAEAEKAQAAAEEREKNATEQMEAAKKTASDQERINSMLTVQLTDATAKLDGYDTLKESETALKSEVAELKHQISEAVATLSHTKELYEAKLADAQTVADRCKALEASEVDLRGKVADAERALADQRKTAESDLRQAQIQSELAVERAAMAKERELHEQIRQSDRENARLMAQIEQLQAQIAQLKAQAIIDKTE